MPTITLSSTTGKWIMASVILASAMAFIDGTALNVALPALQKDLKASATDLFWLNALVRVLHEPYLSNIHNSKHEKKAFCNFNN